MENYYSIEQSNCTKQQEPLKKKKKLKIPQILYINWL